MPACFGRQRGSGLASAAQSLCDHMHITAGHIPSFLFTDGEVSAQPPLVPGVTSCSRGALLAPQHLMPCPQLHARSFQGYNPIPGQQT